MRRKVGRLSPNGEPTDKVIIVSTTIGWIQSIISTSFPNVYSAVLRFTTGHTGHCKKDDRAADPRCAEKLKEQPCANAKPMVETLSRRLLCAFRSKCVVYGARNGFVGAHNSRERMVHQGRTICRSISLCAINPSRQQLGLVMNSVAHDHRDIQIVFDRHISGIPDVALQIMLPIGRPVRRRLIGIQSGSLCPSAAQPLGSEVDRIGFSEVARS